MYYWNSETKESQWERPDKAATRKRKHSAVMATVTCSHLLVKSKESRRPSSWRQDNITKSKDEALKELTGI